MGTLEFVILALWVVSACLFGAAFTMVGPKPEDYRRARHFFVLAGILFGVTGIMWGLESIAPTWARLLVVGSVGAVSLIGIAEGLRFLNERQSDSHATTAEAPIEKSAPVEKIAQNPDVALSFVYSKSPALVLENRSDFIAKQIKWSVILWNLDDPRVYSNQAVVIKDSHEPLQIPVGIFDFINGKGRGGPQSLFSSALVAPYVKNGN